MKPIGVLIDESLLTARENSLMFDSPCYAPEFLQQVGFDFQVYSLESLKGAKPPILWVNGTGPWSERVSEVLAGYVREGGRLLVTGDVRGLGFLAGRTARAALGVERGYLLLEGVPQDFGISRCGVFPIRAGYERNDITAEVEWGRLLDADGRATASPAVAAQRYGEGWAAWIPVDVCRSAVEFQQGLPVIADGVPAEDGTAPINEGILKCDDGSVYRWKDRSYIDGKPAFLTPAVDWLKDWFVRVLWWLSDGDLPQVWYWPHGIRAVGMLSHDSDSNESQHAWQLMDVLEELSIQTTWCVMYPGGYSREVYEALKDKGHEIGLHFEAFSGGENCQWSAECLRFQHEWLKKEAAIAAAKNQKNHLTRWEGWSRFFRWVEAEGITVDQTKGPSKVGNMGFLFGTCHMWKPIDDAAHQNRIIDVLESPFLTADMYGGMEMASLRRRILDEAAKVYGIAHFLFHPQRIVEEGMAEAVKDIVNYGKGKGIPWWTSKELAEWVLARRSISMDRIGEKMWEIKAPVDIQGVTLILPHRQRTYLLDGEPIWTNSVEYHGVVCDEIAFDLEANQIRRLKIGGLPG